MTRKTFFLIGCAVFGLLLVLLLGLFWASRYEPVFYRKALTANASEREKSSDQMLRNMLEFQNNMRKEGSWQATFTTEEINGWLGHDLPKNHPHALPPEFREPCVAIDPQNMHWACRYEKGMTSSVLSLSVEPYVPKPNVLALRITSANAGLLPLPLTKILSGISDAARNLGCRLDWGQTEGNPVALISFPAPDNKGELTIKIKTVKLRDGEIFIAGTTERNK